MLSNNYKFLQWNTLGKNFCDVKSFPYVDSKYLEWTYRKELLQKKLLEIDADLICLEEIDAFDEYKNEIISNYYESIYYSKDNGGQGIAFFYKQNKFNLIKSEKISLPETIDGRKSNQFFSYYLLNTVLTEKTICIIATHLKAKNEFEHIRHIQINYILEYLKNNLQYDIILCGDFNTEPNSITIKSINETNLFTSVYNIDEIEMTTFKIRDKEYYRIIDYIFITNNIKIKDVNPLPRKIDLEYVLKTGLPSIDFPSDHYYLSCTLEI
jgi:mRNA deadenylase 3'-5' endonuclease subunit Ccr4